MSYGHVTKERQVAAPKKIIPIPLFHKDDNYACSTACIAAVLQQYCDNADETEEKLNDLLQATNKSEMGVEQIVTYINQVKFDKNDSWCLISANLKRYMTICDLMQDIDKNIPVICPIQAWYNDPDGNLEEQHDYKEEQTCGHYVVAVGYDSEKIYFMDPAAADTYSYIPIREFDARWHSTEDGEKYTRCGIEVVVHKMNQDVVWVYKIL